MDERDYKALNEHTQDHIDPMYSGGFYKYQHVERFGTDETAGIDNGTCYIFPKIDGTNASLWFNGELQAGSRNRHLSVNDDNAGFYNWALRQVKFKLFFEQYPDVHLFGEWLVPHTIKTYRDDAWKNFYVFDVVNSNGYIPYETYKLMLEEFDIEYIPPICKIKHPSYKQLIGLLENNNYLIKDGEGIGEGIVIKNYEYANRFGRHTWAKIVANEFKAKFRKSNTTEIDGAKIIEDEIVNKFVTLSLVEKEFAKIAKDGWDSKQIPRLLNTVFYCLVKEECWNFVKEFKNPTIDFKRLHFFTINKIKELMPNLF